MHRDTLVAKIEAAKHEIEGAEIELEKLMATLHIMPRAEKTTISVALELAFEQLRAARRNLEGLERLLLSEEPDAT